MNSLIWWNIMNLPTHLTWHLQENPLVLLTRVLRKSPFHFLRLQTPRGAQDGNFSSQVKFSKKVGNVGHNQTFKPIPGFSLCATQHSTRVN
jgi:hypothetical protein